MPFNREHIVISMMAAVDIKELVSLVGKVDESRIVRTVPLPSNSQRTGMLGHKWMVVSRTVLENPQSVHADSTGALILQECSMGLSTKNKSLSAVQQSYFYFLCCLRHLFILLLLWFSLSFSQSLIYSSGFYQARFYYTPQMKRRSPSSPLSGLQWCV